MSLLSGNVSFYDNSTNDSTDPNSIVGLPTFLDNSSNQGVILSGLFSGNSFNVGEVQASATFVGSAINSGSVAVATFDDGASNLGTITSSGSFYGTAVNSGIVGVAIFTGNAINLGTISGSGLFYGTAVNSGVISGNAIFADTTTNNGTVEGNANFATGASNQGGTVNGETGVYTPPVANWYDDASSYNRVVNKTVNGIINQGDDGNGVKYAHFTTYNSTYNEGFTFSLAENEKITTQDFTIEFFANQTSQLGGYNRFIGLFNNLNTSSANEALLLNPGHSSFSSSAYSFELYYNGTSASSLSDQPITYNEWKHYAIVRDGSYLKLYINGILQTSSTINLSASFDGFIYGEIGNFYGKIAGFRMVVGSALYTSNFAVPTSLPTAVNGTQLLLNFGATSAPYVPNWYDDTSSAARIITLNGTVTQSDEGDGVKAAMISTNSRIVLDTNAGMDFGTDDYTIEMFIKATDLLINASTIIDFNYNNRRITADNGRLVYYAGGGFGSNYFSGFCPTSDLVNKWNHIAISRANGVVTLYFNGVSVGSEADNISYDSGGRLSIGSRYNEFTNSLSSSIFIASLRVIKGVAIYTSNFAVPTSLLTAVTGTQLLLNFGATSAPYVSLWYNDTSAAARAVVLNGTVTQEDEGNGVLVAQFDNGSDGLVMTDTDIVDFGIGDFTVEFFIKPASTNYGTVFDSRTTVYINNNFHIAWFDGAIRYITNNSNGNIGPSKTLTVGAWSHVAVVRNSGYSVLYVNGIAAEAPWEDSRNINDIGSLYIGKTYDNNNFSFSGKLAGLRIAKGTAIYTANFSTPTSLPTAATGTELLLNFGATAVPRVLNWYDDTSSAARIVNLNGGVTQSNEGNGVIAAEFNGTNGFFDINSFNFDLSQDSTIEFWMKPTLNGQNTILGYSQTGYPELNIGINNNNLFFTNNALTDVGGAFVPDVGQWQHVAIVTQSGVKKIYKNGVLISTNTQTFNNLTKLYIGYLHGYYSGKLAGLRMVAGQALYTSDFQIPTSLLANVTGSTVTTQLLLNFGATAVPNALQLYTVVGPGNVKYFTNILAIGGYIYYNNGAAASNSGLEIGGYIYDTDQYGQIYYITDIDPYN